MRKIVLNTVLRFVCYFIEFTKFSENISLLAIIARYGFPIKMNIVEVYLWTK